VRKYVVILIALIYTTLSVGINLHLHYCCGKLANIHLVGSEHNCCDTTEHNHDGCELGKHCCSNEDIKVSIDEKHQPSQFKVTFVASQSFPVSYTIREFAFIIVAKQTISFGTDSDPPAKLPVYLMQHSLLFYA